MMRSEARTIRNVAIVLAKIVPTVAMLDVLNALVCEEELEDAEYQIAQRLLEELMPRCPNAVELAHGEVELVDVDEMTAELAK